MTPRQRRRLGVLVGIALLIPVLGAAPASASPIDQHKAEAARLQRQIDVLGHRVSMLDEQYNQALLRAQRADAGLARAQSDLAAADQTFAQVRGRLAQQAVNAYIQGGSASLFSQLVHSNGSDLAIRRQYMAVAADEQQRTMDDMRQVREDLRDLRARLQSAQRADQDALSAVAATRRSVSAAEASERATLGRVRGELAGLVAAEQQRVAALSAARAQAALRSRLVRARNGGSTASGPFADPPASAGAAAAVAEARRQLGKPYRYGGAGPDSFDCSGLTMWSWRAGGVSLDHSAAAQYNQVTHVSFSSLQPGDLIFYGSAIYHVGIYVGGGEIINALQTGTNVEYDSMYTPGTPAGAGRP